MSLLQRIFRVLIVMGFLWPAASIDARETLVADIAGSINPAVVHYMKACLEQAENSNAACLVFRLDTPGGLAESMHEIVMDMLSAKTPVVVYVAPSGARAASAGVMIMLAADIAAMAPGTHMGAAHPVGIGGKDIQGAMSDKVTNDMAAFARTVAEKRGRNPLWAEKSVRESVSVTETEALKEKIIDLTAENLEDLLSQINGRNIPGKGVLQIDPDQVRTIPQDLRTRILKIIGDPNVAYILMMIGLAGLYFELAHPGAILPGVVGGIAIILAFFAFQTLPVNYAGILLILLALVFFILEIKIISHGMLSIAGIASLLLGSLMLFESPGPQVALKVMIPTVALVSGFFVGVIALVLRSQLAQPRTGAEALVGTIGLAKTDIALEGRVAIHGEVWNAFSKEPIRIGNRVKVKQVVDLTLEVEAFLDE